MSVLKAALLGRSLPYSISPEVHYAIFDILKHKIKSDFSSLNYSKIECKDENVFQDTVWSGKQNGFTGFNVTFPYKYSAATMQGELSPVVRLIHSSNTITCADPLAVISTDGDGFRFAIQRSIPNLIARDFSLVIVGAGGAARAVLYVLRGLGWRTITVVARSLEAAVRVASVYDNVRPVVLSEFIRDSDPQFIVHATPVGQRSADALLETFAWQSVDIAADLVYNPLCTRFLDSAERAGASILDGLGMLIEQAALSQYFWMTGNEATESVLSSEEFHALHRSLSTLLTPRWDAFVS